MEQVTEQQRKEMEPNDFTMYLDNPQRPQVMYVTIPIKGLTEAAEKGEHVATQVGAHLFNFGIMALKTVSVAQAQKRQSGILKPGAPKLAVH